MSMYIKNEHTEVKYVVTEVKKKKKPTIVNYRLDKFLGYFSQFDFRTKDHITLYGERKL